MMAKTNKCQECWLYFLQRHWLTPFSLFPLIWFTSSLPLTWDFNILLNSLLAGWFGSWWTPDALISFPSNLFYTLTAVIFRFELTSKSPEDLLKHRTLSCILTGSNSVSLWRGPRVCTANDSQVILMLFMQRPHFENQCLWILLISWKSFSHSPIFTSLYWLLMVFPIKLKLSKLFRDLYHVAPQSILSAHLQIVSPWVPDALARRIIQCLENVPKYFFSFKLLFCCPNPPGKPFLFISISQSFKSQHKCSLHHEVSLILYLGRSQVMSHFSELFTFHFSYANFCFLNFLLFLLEYISKFFY